MGVVAEFVVIGDLIGSGEVQEDGLSVRRRTSQPAHGSMPRPPNSASIASKTNLAGITARVVQRMMVARVAELPTVN